MSSKKKISMLVVDDEKTLVWAMKECFESQGMEVATAADGASAIAQIQAGVFDVIITDLKMPDASGIDVARAAREANPDTVIIILTAFGSFESAVEALRLGVDDYLSKPFRIDSLNMAVSQALEKRRAASVSGSASACGNYSFPPVFPTRLCRAVSGELYCDRPACGEFFDIYCVPDGTHCSFVIGRIEIPGSDADRLSLLVSGYLSALIACGGKPQNIFSSLLGFLRAKGATDARFHCFAGLIDMEKNSLSYCSCGDVLVFFHDFKARSATILVSSPALEIGQANAAEVKTTRMDIASGDQLLFALSRAELDETLSVNLISKIEHEIKLRNISVAERAHEFVKELNGGSPSVVSMGVNRVLGGKNHVRVELDAESKSVIWEAKSLVEMLCRELMMDEMESHALVSASLEIIINCMVHAYSESRDKIVCEISTAADSVTVSIQDFGCGFDLRKYRRPSTASVEDVLDPDSRRGLFIAQNCVEKLEIASSPKSGTVVKLTQPLYVAGGKK